MAFGTLLAKANKLCINENLVQAYLLKVERLSTEPESKGAINPGSGKPLWDGKGDGGLKCSKFM